MHFRRKENKFDMRFTFVLTGSLFIKSFSFFSPKVVGLIQYAQGIFLKSPSVISVVPLFE